MAFTYFFRDLQTLEAVRDYALPQLKTRRYIHIWDAGCAMGHEPYSLAIILRESMGYMYFRNLRIKASDIDGSNLFGEIIRRGVYSGEQLQRIPRELFMKYFAPTSQPQSFQINVDLRRAVSFQKHDLLTLEPVGGDFGLILCKNVLLHFSEAERAAVLRMFHAALASGGYLALEQTQKMPEAVDGMFEQVAPRARLFRKVG